MKTLYLVRGLPAAGKSTLARALAKIIFEADQFFIGPDNVYRFLPKLVGVAHDRCQKSTRARLDMGDSVAVANTFTQRWEIEPYRIIAEETGARLVVLSLFDGGMSDEQLAERNVHGVPVESIAAMRARFEHDWMAGNPTPPWAREAAGRAV